MPAVVSLRQQTGVALLSVLLIFALVSVLTIHMIDQQYLDIRRTQHLMAQDQAIVYGVSAEALAIRALYEDYKKDNQGSTPLDSLQDDWQQAVSFPVEGGNIQAKLTDLQSKLNLNNIKHDYGGSRAALKHLITLLDVHADAEMIVDSMVQWMDEDDIPQGVGAEESYYLGLDPGYRTANQVFVQVSELRLIRGMNNDLYQKLLPYVTVLPEKTAVNLNTAEPLVLESYTGMGDVKDLVAKREQAAFSSVEAALTNRAKPADTSGFSVISHYFLLAADVLLDDRQIHSQSIIYRPQQVTAEESIRVIQRDRGRRFTSGATSG